MRFEKMYLESNLCFMDYRSMIPGLDELVELSSLVGDVLCLLDCFRVRIRAIFHVSLFNKFFHFIEKLSTGVTGS